MIGGRWIFDLGASSYDRITDQDLWREQIVRLLDHVGDPSRIVRVLDLGCGPGVSSFALAESLGPDVEILGVDLSPKMIERARSHHRRRYAHLGQVRFQCADATALPFDAGGFQLATGHSFLYLVGDPAAVLAEVVRVVAPGGRLVLMEPHAAGSLLGAARAGAASWRELFARPSAALRFVYSMVSWRLAARMAGALSAPRVERLFRDAGFRAVWCHPTLGGLGLHCVGEL